MDKGRGARQNNWYVHIRTIIISISTTILQIHGNESFELNYSIRADIHLTFLSVAVGPR